jgi:hypothetical protein
MAFLPAAGVLGWADGVQFGVHGGLSIPNIRGSSTDVFTSNFSSREGPFFGLSANIGLAGHFSLVVELNYNSQGGTRNGLQVVTELPPGLPVPPGTLLYANFKDDVILNYVELPVMGRFTFGHKVRFFVNAGPCIGYLVRAEAKTRGSSALYLDKGGTMPIIIPPDTNPLVVSLNADTDVMSSLKKTNFGLAGGGGVIYPLGRGDLILEAHFQAGLLTIQKDTATSGSSETGAIVISLGYLFSLR